ncbi:MAG TPA: choice-of-anchor tandem repeat GloVer-containing protein [Candidatus Methylacidiphilales bacterium]|nr:choice-of-anchor tandem repeat GloVer-containing protein [Candidatus Methylacidiphilales bacterium]
MLAASVMTFGLMASVHAQTSLTTLHDFSSRSGGIEPSSPLTQSGNILYGVTQAGGPSNSTFGVLYSVKTDGSDFTALYNFTGYASDPGGALVLSGGKLYGTVGGGSGGGGYGTGAVYSVNTDGTGFTILHQFNGTDGFGSDAGLILSGSTLYGTTNVGAEGIGGGTVYKLKTDGTGFTTLHSFSGSDGDTLYAGVVLSGNTLYGATSEGGTYGYGTIFSVKTDGTGFTVLYNFNGTNDGGVPYGTLVLSGNTLYGTASGYTFTGDVVSGNAVNQATDYGVIFSIHTDGSNFTTLHSFGQSDGYPFSGLTLSGSTLYGVSGQELFSIKTNGANFTSLYTFTGGADGSGPSASPILSNNVLYGVTASSDGGYGYGTVYAATLNFSGQYEIQCVASGLAANVKGGSSSNGTPIIQWPFSGTGNEVWTFIPTSNGYYQINNVQTGKDLVVQGASTAGGAKIVEWSFGSSGDDQWKPVSNSDGSYTFYNLHSGLALDDPSGSTSQGTQFDQWAADHDTNQEFDLIPQL